jgi:hypothetical protein
MSKRTYPIPNKNLSGSDYIQNKRAKQLFSGTSNLAKTIEQQNGNFPLLTPSGKLKPYQGTFGLSGRMNLSEKTYCLNTSHSYGDLLAITKGKYLLTPPNISNQSTILLKDVSESEKLYNGIYYAYIYSNTTNALYYMNPAYPDPSGNYIANKIQYDITGNANQRIIVDPSYVLSYVSQSCILKNNVSSNIEINNNYESRYSFNRTMNLALLSGFNYPSKFSLDYDLDDCINTNNDLQSKYEFPSSLFNMSPPVISGSASVNSTLILTNVGTWSDSPVPTLNYKWYRGDTLIDENTTSYTIQASDVGQPITCHVTATNSNGSATAISNSITYIDPPKNTLTSPPVISGISSYSVGSTLRLTDVGTWSGYPAPTLTYQWYRGSTLILSATNTGYTIQASDVGQSITCQVTGTNAYGSATAISSPITPTGPPVINNNNDTPQISGISPYSVGSILTITNAGTWTGYPAPTLTYQWYRGDTLIAENTTSYTIQASDAGQSITCHVTGTNASGSFTAIINPITPTGPPVINNNDTHQISGNALVGSTLTITNVTWNGYPAPTLTYQWYRGSTLILSATSTSYTTQAADVGQSITCQVTATNASGSFTAISSPIIPTGPPVNTNNDTPQISGISPYSVGSTLTLSNPGTWTGYPTPTLYYQWYRGNNPLSSEISTRYTIVTTDIGQSITCHVTATNAYGSATAISSPITPTGPPVINNNDTHQISGNALVGSILTITNAGTWNGYPAPTLTYQWYRGDTLILSATSTSYTTQAADVGQSITCQVTGTNASGSFTAISSPITPTGPPNNSVQPVISGSASVGSTLTITNAGTWNGYPAPTLTYKWYSGDTLIAENTTSYTIQASDVVQPITCQVTATNTSGSATAISKPITPGIPPGINNNNNDTPQISGISPYSVGSILTITNAGTWNGYPAPTLTYKWYRGNNPLSSEISTSYTIVTTDIGQQIRCQITGTNAIGFATAISNSITPTGPPSNSVRPVVTGDIAVGSTLTITNAGTWNGYPAPTLTYKWYRGDTLIADNTTSYTIQASDVGQSITYQVTGTNASGSATAISSPIGLSGPPVNTNNDIPQISGISPYSVGSILRLTHAGRWNGYPNPTLTYQWYRGDTPLSGKTSTSYTTQAADVGQPITCHVTATNAIGSAIAISISIIPTSPPSNSVRPVVTGGIAVGYVATSTSGSWTGYPTPTLTYNWYRGDTLIAENTTSYTIQASDVVQPITCQVTATNTSGSATAISKPITPGIPPGINNNNNDTP